MSEKVIDRAINAGMSSSSRERSSERNIVAIAKDGGITFAGKMFLSAVRLVTAVIVARLLGADQYGMYNLALSTANIAIGLAVFGLDSALIRYIAIQASRKDEKGVWGTLQVGVGVATLLSVITGTFIFGLAYYLAETVFHEPRLVPLLQFTGVIVPLLTMSEVLAGALRGFKRMDYPVIAQFVFQPVVRLIMIVVLAFTGFNTVHAILTFGLADLAASIMLIYFLNKEFSLRRSVRAARRDFRTIFEFSIPVWLSEMLVKFHGNIQTLILGSLNTITGVGIFSVASQISMVSSQFSSSINTSAKPVIAELHDRADMREMGQIYQTANKWAVMVQIPIFITMVLFPAPILSLFGESFTDGALALSIIALADLLKVGTGMGGIIIDMTGYTKLKLVNSIFRLVANLGLDILLIPRWGLLGAAVAALIGEGFINLLRLFQVFFLFRLIPYNRTFIKPVIAGVITLASAFLIKTWLILDGGLFFVIANTGLLLAVYLGMTLLMGFSPEDQAVIGFIRQRANKLFSKNSGK